MSKEQLGHIFEHTACLNARQMKGYVSGKMVHEECHAVEVHLLSCPFCSEALEGLIAEKDHGAVSVMEKLDAGFIAKQLGISSQEINTGVKTPPVIKAGAYSTQPEKAKTTPAVSRLWKPLAVAASLIAAACIMWFMRDTIFPQNTNTLVAEQVASPETKPEPEIAYQPLADTLATDTTAITEDIAVQEPQPVKKDTVLTALTPKELLAKKEADKKAADAKAALAAAKNLKKENTADKTSVPATTAAAAPARMGNSYESDEALSASKNAEEDKEETAAAKKVPENARTGIEKADELYNKGKFKRALKLYQDEMYDTKSNRKDAATYMAAKCHIGLGENTQARTLLNSLVNENSPKKAQAQQLLKEVGE